MLVWLLSIVRLCRELAAERVCTTHVWQGRRLGIINCRALSYSVVSWFTPGNATAQAAGACGAVAARAARRAGDVDAGAPHRAYNPIIHLQKGNYQKFIHGFQFELNSDSVSTICKDKGAISIILDFHQIPHVEHRTFSLSPQKTSTDESLWTSIQNFAQKYNFDIVCKPNNGFSGRDVHHTRSQKELEKIVHKLLSIDSEFCISPFYKAEFEYRVIVINDRPELIWCKECFALVGDGHSKLKTLF